MCPGEACQYLATPGGPRMRRLSKLVVATVSTIAYAQIASNTAGFAVDVATRAPNAPLPPPSSWAGLYLGVTGGYGWKDDQFSTVTQFGTGTAPLIIDGVHSKGGVFGGYAGYNW